MLAGQIIDIYWSILCSWMAKIVKRRILVQFLFISRNYTYFLANKSTTFDNFVLEILACHTLTLFAWARIQVCHQWVNVNVSMINETSTSSDCNNDFYVNAGCFFIYIVVSISCAVDWLLYWWWFPKTGLSVGEVSALEVCSMNHYNRGRIMSKALKRHRLNAHNFQHN